MADYTRLFKESLTGRNSLEKKLTPRFEFADSVTFAANKKTPTYNWFYYKEGFSQDFVSSALQELKVAENSTVLDPFCGTGTTLLASKQSGFNSIGFDILPLGVFVSKVKLEQDYDLEKLETEYRKLCSLKYSKPSSKLVDIRFIDMRKVYNPYARDDIAFFRENIMQVEDEKIRNFLLLGLISIVSQASNVMKDGGVLRIVRKQHVPPVRHLLKNKLKRMLEDLKNAGKSDASWTVNLGDARNLPLEDSNVDSVITSPPYLNFVDYTKVYALELSLLVSSAKEMEDLRKRSMRSHISAEYSNDESSGRIDALLEKVSQINDNAKLPLVVEGYLKDLYLSVKEVARVLKKGGCAVFVVANAALPGITVDIDLLLAEIGEQNGLTVEDIWVANARWADVHGINKPRPVRESAVVLRKK